MKQMCVTVKGQTVLLASPKNWTVEAVKTLVQKLKLLHRTTNVEVFLVQQSLESFLRRA